MFSEFIAIYWQYIGNKCLATQPCSEGESDFSDAIMLTFRLNQGTNRNWKWIPTNVFDSCWFKDIWKQLCPSWSATKWGTDWFKIGNHPITCVLLALLTPIWQPISKATLTGRKLTLLSAQVETQNYTTSLIPRNTFLPGRWKWTDCPITFSTCKEPTRLVCWSWRTGTPLSENRLIVKSVAAF